MKVPFKERSISTAVVIPSAIIVAALAVLQYRWSTRISEATAVQARRQSANVDDELAEGFLPLLFGNRPGPAHRSRRRTRRAMPANMSGDSPSGKRWRSIRSWYPTSIY